MVVDILIIVVSFLAGFLLAVGIRMGMPPVVGELTVDTHDWQIDRYKFNINKIPLDELTEHKYVAMKVTQAIIPDRDTNNDFNDTN